MSDEDCEEVAVDEWDKIVLSTRSDEQYDLKPFTFTIDDEDVLLPEEVSTGELMAWGGWFAVRHHRSLKPIAMSEVEEARVQRQISPDTSARFIVGFLVVTSVVGGLVIFGAANSL